MAMLFEISPFQKFKSLKLSLIGIIPNIFASTFILGIIGYLSIPLDIMTITIAAITIGIAVDNTIHYLYRYIEFKKNNTMIDSIYYTNSSAGLETKGLNNTEILNIYNINIKEKYINLNGEEISVNPSNVIFIENQL